MISKTLWMHISPFIKTFVDRDFFYYFCSMKRPIESFPIFIIACLFCLANSLTSAAQVPPKPLWVQKGVKSLNDKRFSTDYHFVAFHHQLTDEKVVETSRLYLLRENMAKEFNVDPQSISIDSIVSSDNNQPIYSITFPAHNSDENTRVYVKEVDSYTRYNDNINDSFDYELDELYAISEKDITPVFDDFKVSRKYNGLPVAMSLVPGLGQIYKGQAAKGYSILGSEVVFCAAIAFGEIYRNYYLKKGYKDPELFASWKSKASTFQTIRNIGIVLASATYLYNIFDAAFAKGAPHVVISRPKNKPMDMVFFPDASSHHLGAAISITF